VIRRTLRPAVMAFGVAAVSCNGTTGDDLLTFPAYASGVPGAAEPFQAGEFSIRLTAARMHIGDVYFDEAPPGTGFDGPVCLASGIYAAQVPGPVDVDLLSTAPQEFAVYGNGTADTALSWQLWLTDDSVGVDNVNSANFTPIVQLEGVATNTAGESVSFGAIVTINAVNRSKGSSDPSQPGNSPLCKARIVQIGGITLPFSPGGTLSITVDPRVWFTQQSLFIDFSPGQLPAITDPSCNPDSSVFTNPASYALAPETPPPASQTCGGSGQPCCATEDAGAGDAGPSCLEALTCTAGTCGPTYCIPNSSFLPGADPGATAGLDLFTEITSAAPFSVSFASQ
jgi:hypothetical protein